MHAQLVIDVAEKIVVMPSLHQWSVSVRGDEFLLQTTLEDPKKTSPGRVAVHGRLLTR